MQLSKKQSEYIGAATHRWNLKVGAVRSGKSFVDVVYSIPARLRAGHGKDGLNVILGVSRETIERNVLQPMRELYTSRLVGTINGRNIARICGEEGVQPGEPDALAEGVHRPWRLGYVRPAIHDI